MNNQSIGCSTPVYGDDRIIDLNLTLSEIRKGNTSKIQNGEIAAGDNSAVLSVIKKKFKLRQDRGKVISKNRFQLKRTFIQDSDSDSNYETVDETSDVELHDINNNSDQESDNLQLSQNNYRRRILNTTTENTQAIDLSQSRNNENNNNSDELSIKLFQFDLSDIDDDYDNYFQSSLETLELINNGDDTTFVLSKPIASYPVQQKAFKNPTKYKPYAKPSKLHRARVTSKFNSPSDIPTRNDTLIAADKNRESLSKFSKTHSYRAERCWDDMENKDMNLLSKSLGLNREKLASKKENMNHNNTTYSYLLDVENQLQYKRLISPTKKLATRSKKEDVYDWPWQESSANETKIKGNKKSNKKVKRESETESSYDTGEIIVTANRHSHLTTTRKRTKSSSKYDESSLQLENTLEEYIKSIDSTDPDLAVLSKSKSNANHNAVTKKSKPKITSVEIIKRAKKF